MAALKLERDTLKRLLRDRESAEGKVLHTGAQHQFIIIIFIGFVGMSLFSNLQSVVAAVLQSYQFLLFRYLPYHPYLQGADDKLGQFLNQGI